MSYCISICCTQLRILYQIAFTCKRNSAGKTVTNRVSTVREKVREKNIFSSQGILKFVREFWNLSKSQGKVREF